MDLSFLIRGLVIGFSIAAPVGPIGLLCIQRTLARGRLVGLVSGLGAATADALYGALAGFGLTFVAGFLISQQIYLRLAGGVFLGYLGVRTLRARPAARAATPGAGRGLIGAYASTLALTITNPLTILSFTAIFVGLGVTGGSVPNAVLLVAGVFLGSACWWLLLSSVVGAFRERLGPAHLVWVNRLSGAIILALALLALSVLL